MFIICLTILAFIVWDLKFNLKLKDENDAVKSLTEFMDSKFKLKNTDFELISVTKHDYYFELNISLKDHNLKIPTYYELNSRSGNIVSAL